MMITRRSELTGKIHHRELLVTAAQLENFHRGMAPALAFPDLDTDEIEFVQTGITPDEFDKMWEGA